MSRTPPTRLLAAVVALLAAAALTAPTVASAQSAPACDAPVASSTQQGYTVADPDCEVPSGKPFAALPGATAYTGIADGQAYRIEVPKNWNGKLVMYAHGFRGTGTTVYVSSPALRQRFVDRGYAWAASSYQRNAYAVEQGVQDTQAMVQRFKDVVPGAAERLGEVLVQGESMGGQVTAVLAERYPQTYSAAYPVCGALGGTELFDYFVDANVTAAALADARIGYEEYAADPGSYQDLVQAEVLPDLFTTRPALTPAGRTWADAVERRSGGERPGFDSGFTFWNSIGFAPLTEVPFLFGVYPGLTAGTIQVATGNVAGNADTRYQLDDDPRPSAQEDQLNAEVLRVTEDPQARGIPDPQGTASVPVLSLHTLGDLFVPFSMEQSYARKTAANGGTFVSRAVRGTGHCDFTPDELAKGFDDLVLWEETGRVPAGDPVLDPAAVAAPTFGCRFTSRTRPGFSDTACPTFPDVQLSVHRRAVESLLAAGIVQGSGGRFRPDDAVSRAQLASIVAKAGGYTASASAPTFPDAAGTVHEPAIRALAEAGLVRGYDDGRYYPSRPTTRGQLASVLARVLDVSSTDTGCFPDLAGSAEAADVCALAELGVVGGKADGRFEPGAGVTRGQAASLVTRVFG